jgi:hypothetical protein
LNDDDADGVPDYVERVADGADTAIAYFERRGFHAILSDSGGPDSRPDLYLSRFTPGTFGVAFPATLADGGAFVAIANGLDPSAARSLGSLYGVVAHELFHLVQFSYFTRGGAVNPDLGRGGEYSRDGGARVSGPRRHARHASELGAQCAPRPRSSVDRAAVS